MITLPKSLAVGAALASLVACSNTEFQGSTFSSRGRNLTALQVENFGVSGDERLKKATQGSAGQEQSESFVQNASSPLDIVMVVDNSGSMADEQANLASKLSSLLSAVEATDWRIGITSTDLADGPLIRQISKGDPNVQTTFSDTINGLGISGSGHEMGIAQAMHAAQAGIQGSSRWIRGNSGLAVLIVSDEDNCSGEDGIYNCGPVRAGFSRGQLRSMRNKSYLLDYLQDVRTFKDTTRVYGIINTPGSRSRCPEVPDAESFIYADAIRTTGGLSGSICDNSYEATLKEISKDFVAVLNVDYNLSDTPNAGSVKVTVNGQDFSNKFSVNGKTIKFSQVPPEGAKINVNYVTGKSNEIGLISLSGDRIADVNVNVNGRNLAANEFTFDKNARTVSIKTKLNKGDKVSVFYKSGSPLRTLTLSRIPKSVEEIKVYAGNPRDRGSVALSAKQFSYDSQTNTVAINSSVADPATTFFVQYPPK